MSLAERSYPLPSNEDQRLAALHATRLLDSPREEVFECITRTAKALSHMPIALISLVDKDRQWFKAKCGLEADSTARDISLCTHAILDTQVMVVEDASKDTRFCANPLVTGDMGLRFYAGAPIIIPDGIILGTLCIIDTKPHHDFGLQQQIALADLAYLTAHIIELRLSQLKN